MSSAPAALLQVRDVQNITNPTETAASHDTQQTVMDCQSNYTPYNLRRVILKIFLQHDFHRYSL